MIKCRQCKYFVDDGGNEPPYFSVGESREGWGKCKLGQGDDGQPAHSTSFAYAVDPSGYAAILRVHKNYGCIQGEWK